MHGALKMLKYKFYNKKLIVIFLAFLVFIAGINIIVDPYEIFGFVSVNKFNKFKPELERNQRVTEIIALKLEKNPVDTIFLGSSRVNSTISEKYYSKITGGKSVKNLGMNALSHDETIKMAKNIVKIHPEIKDIYVGLDFFRFLEKNKDNKRPVYFSTNKNLTISEFNPVILSFNATLSSINTILVNLNIVKPKFSKYKKTNNLVVDAFKYILVRYGGNYNNAVLSTGEIIKLKNFKTYMENQGYKVHFYINPTHALDISLINQFGYLPVFEQWKISLAENFDYVDFDWVNDFTGENIDSKTKYFLEMSHANTEFGYIILDNLILNKNNYGIYTNKHNVKDNLIIQKKALADWEAKNPQWEVEIRKVINNAI